MRPMKARNRRVWRIALAGFVFLASGPAALRAQLEVDELELFLTAGAAGSVSATFNVRNTSRTAQTVQIERQDWDRQENGRNRFLSAGAVTGTCHPAIEVFPTIAQLDAGQTQVVRVTYTGGARERACWSAVSVGTAPVPPDTAGVQLVVNLEHIVKIYVDPPTPTRTIEIGELDVVRAVAQPGSMAPDSTSRDVMVTVRGSGNAQARVKGSVEYRTAADSVVATVRIDEFPVLPGAVRRLHSRMPALPAGRYIVLVMFDYGGQDLIAGQIELEIQR